MIRLLLFVVAACHVIQAAKFEVCPDKTACIYHATCALPKPEANETVLATRDPAANLDDWTQANCRRGDSIVQFFLQPLSSRRWNLTLNAEIKNVGIQFGDALIMIVNRTDATFKEDSQEFKVPIERKANGNFQVVIESHTKPLLDICNRAPIIYVDDTITNGVSSSVQADFWKQVERLIPCDASLIVDIEKGENSTLVQDEAKVECKSGNLWLNSADKSWQQLTTPLKCGSDKEWAPINEKGAAVENKGKLYLKCAAEKPDPWESTTTTTSTTSTTTSATTTSTTADDTVANKTTAATTTTESPTTSTKTASDILHSLIVPLLISGLLLI